MSHGPYWKSVQRFPTIRQSRGVAFDACALSMKIDADYRSEWSGHPQMRGQVMHRVFAEALRKMAELGENQIPTDAMIEILADQLRQDDVDRECPECGQPIVTNDAGTVECPQGHVFAANFGNLPLKEIKDMRWVAIKWAHDNTFDIENLVEIEKRLSATITYPDGNGGQVERVLTGQLDAWFTNEQGDEAVVLDWKDSWSLPAPTDVGFDGYAQQRWYAWLVLRNFPAIQRVTLREFYVRFSQPREAVVHREELPWVELELSALIERFDRSVHTNTYPPSPGRHCQVCARPGACPIFPGVKVEGMITSEAMARRVAGEAMTAKSALKHRETALKAWSSVRGDVELSTDAGRERVWGYVERKRRKRPTRDELERAMYLKGSQVNLDELYEEQTITRYEVHAPRKVEDTADDAYLMNALTKSLEQQQQSEPTDA